MLSRLTIAVVLMLAPAIADAELRCQDLTALGDLAQADFASIRGADEHRTGWTYYRTTRSLLGAAKCKLSKFGRVEYQCVWRVGDRERARRVSGFHADIARCFPGARVETIRDGQTFVVSRTPKERSFSIDLRVPRHHQILLTIIRGN